MATIENFILRFKTEGTNAIRGVTDQLNNLASQSGIAGDALTSIGGKFGIVGAAAAAAGGAFIALGLRAVNLADDLQDLSSATGISASKILSFKQSLVDAGGKADDYASILTKLRQGTEEAAGGNEKFQKAFQALGIYVRDANGQIRSGNDILDELIQKFQSGAISGAKYAAAVDLLGKDINKLDLTKLKAINDPFQDENIKQLAKYREAMDNIALSIERGLLTAFGKVATEIDRQWQKAEEINRKAEAAAAERERKLNEQGRTGVFRFGDRSGQGFSITPGGGISRQMTAQELEQRRQAELMSAYRSRAGVGRAEPPKPAPARRGGDFGATPEATLKAIADSKTRIEQSQLEAKKLAELMNADDIAKIEIAAKYDVERAKAEIQNKERLSQSQKDAEFAAKKTEIEAKAALDIAKLQQDAAKQATDQTKAFQNQTAELEGRFNLQQSILGLSEVERDRQTKLFEALQDQKKALEDIAKIKNLPGDERLQREQDINAEYEKRIALINKEADIRAKREANFAQGAQEAIDNYMKSFTAFKQGEMMAQSVFSNMDSALSRFVETGKLNFGDLARSIIQDLLKIQLKAAVVGVFQAMGGGAGILGLFGLPTRAGGGPVTGTQPYMVGEKGPELFIPSTSGTIVPNGQGYGRSAGGTTIINNISAVDAKSVAQLFAENRMTLFGNVEQARRELPMRTR